MIKDKKDLQKKLQITIIIIWYIEVFPSKQIKNSKRTKDYLIKIYFIKTNNYKIFITYIQINLVNRVLQLYLTRFV